MGDGDLRELLAAGGAVFDAPGFDGRDLGDPDGREVDATVGDGGVPAVPAGAPGPDLAPAPLHFGNPLREQEAYESGLALAYRGAVGVVRVSGADRLTWLHSLTSQQLTDLAPGDSRELLILDANGRVKFAAAAIATNDAVWLVTDQDAADELAAFLDSMRFMMRVEVTDLTGEYAAFQTAGAPPISVPDVLVWQDPWPGPSAGGAQYFVGKHPGAHLDTHWYLVPAADAASFAQAALGQLAAEARTGTSQAGPALAGTLAVEATRVASWRPSTPEIDDRTLPAELDWLRTAVHTEKGCYPGQESIARVINLGRPPRRLTFLQLDGSLGELPVPGSPLLMAGRQVGHLTSVANHYEMGPIALGLVKRNLDPAAVLQTGADGQVAAAQELIVPVDGKSDRAPAERPGAGLRRLQGGPGTPLGTGKVGSA